jgi:hypothetical protein
MNCLFIDLYGHSRTIDGAMPRETLADDFRALFIGDNVVELKPDPLEHRRTGMNLHEIIIVKGTVVLHPDFEYGIQITALLDFAVCIGGITHQGGPAKLEVTQIVGMVDHLRTVRVHIKRTVPTPMPNLAVGPVSHVSLITV